MNFGEFATCDTCGAIDMCISLGDDEHICYRCESAPRHAIKQADLQEKVEVYENILHSLHFTSSVTMDRERVGNILDKIGAWSYAHRQGNGELSCEEQEAIIRKAFDKLRGVV